MKSSLLTRAVKEKGSMSKKFNTHLSERFTRISASLSPHWRIGTLCALILMGLACLPGAGARSTLLPAASATPLPAAVLPSPAFPSPTLPQPLPSPQATLTRAVTQVVLPSATQPAKQPEPYLAEGLEPLSPANAARMTLLKELEVKMGYDALFSPDSSRLYVRYYTDTNYRDGAVAAVDLKNGKTLFSLNLWAGKGTPELWISPDGARIASYKTLSPAAQTYDALTGKALDEIRLTSGANSFSLAPHWKTYVEVLPEADPLSLRVSLKDITSQKELWKASLPGQPNPVTPQFSKDGAYLAIVRPLNQTVLSTILDTATGKFVNLPNNLQFFSFSSDGKLLIAKANERTLKIYESKTGVWKQDLTFPDTIVTGAEFSPDGRLIAAYYNYARLVLFEAASGKILFEKDARLWRAHFSPDGRLLLGVADGYPRAVTLWGVR